MSGAPDRNAIVERYNQGCAAYQTAMVALKRGSLTEYEIALRDAATEVIGALEWALRCHLENDRADQLSSDQRRTIERAHFPTLLAILAQTQPPMDQATQARLAECRALRNSLEHAATIPANRAVVQALSDVRRFLVKHLLIAEEKLRVLCPDQPLPGVEAASAPPTEGETPPLAEHRKVGLQRWIDKQLAEGIARARQRQGERYDATLDSLALEARAILTQDALGLCRSGAAPTDPLLAAERTVEEELQRLLRSAGPAGLSAAQTARMQQLLPLLTRRTSLSIEAGWLVPHDSGAAFASASLPSLLVGFALLFSGDASALRERILERPEWAEAAWAAVAAGDDPTAWAALLLDTAPSPALLDRVVVACAAFGAFPRGKLLTESVARAFELCVLALVWFAPQRTNGFSEPIDRLSPWFLPAEIWHRCILDLSHLAHQLPCALDLLVSTERVRDLPEPLRTLVTALDLKLQLSDEKVATVLSLCAAEQAARKGRFDTAFWRGLWSPDEARLESAALESWMRSVGIEAVWLLPDASHLLTVPGESRPAGFLLNRESLRSEWEKAWSMFVQTAEPEAIADAWTKALEFLSGREDDATLRLVRDGFRLLEERGLLPRTLAKIRTELKVLKVDPAENPERPTVFVETLRRANLSSVEFARLIETWTEEPALAWRTLLVAGVPDTAIARWCVTKLALAAKVPAGYRDGPVGIVISGGAIPLSTDSWQLSFQQARQALDWLLDNGSAGAIKIVADACTAGQGTKAVIDPIMGRLKDANLSIPLSQVIWGRVIGRPAGRSALCALAAHGKHPSSINFMRGVSPAGFEDSVWLHAIGLAAGISDREHAESGTERPARSSPDASAVMEEVARLHACFEERLQTAPELAWLNGRPVRMLAAAIAARFGVDVSPLLMSLMQDLVSRPVGIGSIPSASSMFGSALAHLRHHHPSAAAPLLEDALNAPLLELMRGDLAVDFWRTVLKHHGTERVLAAMEPLGWRDVGLGFFDGLLSLDEAQLRRRHLRPEMMRPALLRASEGRFAPDNEFWLQAWKPERTLAEIPELVALVDGEWVTLLLEQSQGWSESGRTQFLRELALYSADARVRSRCLAAICKPE